MGGDSDVLAELQAMKTRLTAQLEHMKERRDYYRDICSNCRHKFYDYLTFHFTCLFLRLTKEEVFVEGYLDVYPELVAEVEEIIRAIDFELVYIFSKR